MRTGTLNLSNFATKKLPKRILQNFIMFYIYVYVYIYIYIYIYINVDDTVGTTKCKR